MNIATANEYVQEIARLMAEIERLRLTDAEREAIVAAVVEADAHQHYGQAETLRGLLERTHDTTRYGNSGTLPDRQ